MIRRAPLLLLLVLFLWPALVFAAPPQTISAAAYSARLQKASGQLERLADAPSPRNLTPVLTPLAKDQRIKRADGQTQLAAGDEFSRLLKTVPANASREDTRRVRDSIVARERTLANWARSTYAPADAQAIVNQLEGSGQIRVGPTWLEQTWSDFRRWIARTFQKLLDWVGSWFPTATPGKMPQVDPALIKALFTATVLALLVAIAFLVWRAVGGRIGRNRRKQGAFAFSPEDAELLSLPPDELRERARKFAQESNFREALRHLYIAMLLGLDARGVWRYDARRTNWEHIAALKSDANRSTLVAPLSDITRRFDRVRYGNAGCAQGDWNRFERDVSELEARTSAA